MNAYELAELTAILRNNPGCDGFTLEAATGDWPIGGNPFHRYYAVFDRNDECVAEVWRWFKDRRWHASTLPGSIILRKTDRLYDTPTEALRAALDGLETS